MIRITRSITIADEEIKEEFVRSSGPGGQNVNKTATAVQLRFDVLHSPSLCADVRKRLIRLGGKRIAKDGVLVIDARRFRTQEQNRRDARNRLTALIQKAARAPKSRRATRPTLLSKQRRLETKKHRGRIKTTRRAVGRSDD